MLEHITRQDLPPSFTAKEDPQEIVDAMLADAIHQRVRQLQSADPDPYSLHKLPFDLRLIYIEHFLLTGDYLI